MSKKMKGVAFDSSPYGVYEDAKARFKHQTLIQDYQELQKEAAAVGNKLETMKHRKLTLLAEVRFLRRRYKYLLKSRSAKTSQEQELVPPQNFQPKSKKIVKVRIHNKKETTLQKTAPISDLNQKERISGGKQAALRNATPVFDINQKEKIYSGKETSLRNPTQLFDLSQKERMYGGKEAIFRNPSLYVDLNEKDRIYNGKEAALQNSALVFDLNQKERTYNGKEAAVQNRTPFIDLNQISREEEELQDCEPLRIEEAKKSLIRSDEQHNDLKLSICRNAGNGSNRAAKRKISWQDQVALRV
ncbi:hypothetical protein F0562_009279 [Nyssa sinensis]|uniref:Uncharacterized protein n=1 Tax=Nyssa sinensis TaxID=561372 RepID=A0A5J4ZYE5_9ASTE|nr:hypothetical protein F0562_009279 [Nyssa sinensis]